MIPVRITVWCLVTSWLGARAGLRLVRLASRWPLILSETLPCPRGHRTPSYGVFTCACSALIEGWVFSRCVVCGQTAGWMECDECGLPIRNPLRP